MVVKSSLLTVVGGVAFETEDLGAGLDLASFLVFGHGNQILIQIFRACEEFTHVLLELANVATQTHETEQLENEFVLVLLTVEQLIVLIIFKQKTLSESIRTLDVFDPFVHAALEVAGVRVYNVNFFEEVEISEVQHSAVEVLELDVGGLVNVSKRRVL